MINRKSRNSQKYIASKPSLIHSDVVNTRGRGISNIKKIYKSTYNLKKKPLFLMKRETYKNFNLHLEKYFNNLKFNDKKENYMYNNNTPYSTIFLTNKSFENGTVRLTVPGKYILKENIVFNPNEKNDFKPTKKQTESKQYPTRTEGAYHLGFFAAITLESKDIILDLNNFSIKQSKLHNLQQRFYANIELANAPFIPNQGPASFSNDNNYKTAHHCLIKNGILGLSSHHGIHGNSMHDILLKNIEITDFEVAGIAMNGGRNNSLININIVGASQNIPVLSSYSQARFIKPFLEKVKKINPNAKLEIHNGTKTIDQIINELDDELNKTFNNVKNNEEIESVLFKNKTKLYDGNIYGLVLNSNGVVIHDFKQKRDEKTIGNENIYLENIKIKDIISEPMEIIGLNPQKLKNPAAERMRQLKAEQQSAYGGKTQVGPVGDVFQVEYNMVNKIYKENVLANAQLIISKYNETKLGTSNISDEVLEWVKKGDKLDNYLNKDLYFTFGGDSMAHTMKGNIGLFISAGKNIISKNVTIDNINTKGSLVGTSKLLKKEQLLKKGGQCIGCCITGSEDIVIVNEKINNVHSKNYPVYLTNNMNSKVKHL